MKRTQKLIVLIMLIIIFLPASGLAQGSRKKGWGHGFSGGGITTDGNISSGYGHFGAGVESLLAGGLGIGLELGYIRWGKFEDGLGVFSPGIIYAFRTDQKTIPFVTLGYTLFFRDGTANGAFFGGGLNHLIGDNWGVRIEFRDQVWAEYGSNVHNPEGRFGVMLSWG